MNILFYFENQINPQRGGTERVADNIAQELRLRGYRVAYLSRRKVEGEYTIPCYFLPDEKGNTPANYSYVKSLVSKLSIDVIINEGGNTEDIYLFSKEHLHDVKIITHLHFNPMLQCKYFYRSLYLPLSIKHPFKSCINLLKWVKAPWNKFNLFRHMKQRYGYMHRYSDKVVLLAPSYVNEYCQIGGIDPINNKCVSIYNPNTYHEVPQPTEKRNMVLFVGRLSYEHKRIDYLLKVWQMVCRKIKDWDLYIVGDGPDKDRLTRYCERHNIRNVHFEGFKDTAAYYAQAKILCMTSITEGSPMVIVEAMQNGVIPIVYNTFSASEYLINDGKDGYVIPPFNANEYAMKMIKTMTDEDLYNEMSKACIKSSQRYNLDTIVDIWEKLLKEI